VSLAIHCKDGVPPKRKVLNAKGNGKPLTYAVVPQTDSVRSLSMNLLYMRCRLWSGIRSTVISHPIGAEGPATQIWVAISTTARARTLLFSNFGK
jgi:hypothetical protein